MAFEPTDVIRENWGRLQVVIDNKDLTFYRGVPTVVESWSSAEPFDDKALVLRFPGITSYESVDTWPIGDFQNVDIWLINDQNERVKKLWEGFVAVSTDDLEPDSNGLTVECMGALYQADLMVKVPSFRHGPQDAAYRIAEELNLRSKYYGLRFKQMNWLSYSSTPNRNGGAWNPLLTGWVQEMLEAAYSPSYMRDGEQAVAIQADQEHDGFMITGDHNTHLTFGDRMPNYGSGTWWNAIFIHLFKDPSFYVTDSYWNSHTKTLWTVSRGGHLGIRYDTRDSLRFDNIYKGSPSLKFWGTGKKPESPFDLGWVAIHSLDDDSGYRIANVHGKVQCYGAAAHYGDSPPQTRRKFANGRWLTIDLVVDMCRTPSGNGYWLLTWGGRLYAYGDATDFGHFDLNNTIYVALECTEDGTGLWALDAEGIIFTKGTAVNYGQPGPESNVKQNGKAIDMTRAHSGEGYYVLITDGNVGTYGDAARLGQGKFELHPLSGGNVTQWTLSKHMGRMPIMRTKNTWTRDWHVTVGTPGVTHSLTRERLAMPNVFYGEGVDPNGCRWRNTKYPNFNPKSAVPPLYPGYEMSVSRNSTAPGVRQWQERMKQNGWPIQVDGRFDHYDRDLARFVQHLAGLTMTGTINAQLWAATFEPGANAGKLDSAYIAPLAIDPRVEPFLYHANGSIKGPNPQFDKSIMRIETYNNYGENSSKREAQISALNELKRNADPGVFGTLTLNVDPEEGSRFEMRAGQNVFYRGYGGEGTLLHITEANVNIESGTVTLTVDSKARDNQTVSAMRERDRAVGEPSMVPTRPTRSKGKQVEDKMVFDCESGAGIIPGFIMPALQWVVLRIPMGDVGSIVRSEFRTSPAASYSVAVFDRQIKPSTLLSHRPPRPEDEQTNPFDGTPFGNSNYWKDFPEHWGLLISWGEMNNMGGYYPGQQPRGDDEEDVANNPLTGRLLDASNWNFWSSKPPWVWVAIITSKQTNFSGRFYPGGDTGYNLGGTDAVANPMEISPVDRPSSAYFGD